MPLPTTTSHDYVMIKRFITSTSIAATDCSGGAEPDSKRSSPIAAAAEPISLEEGSSNRRPSRRASRRASRKRSSLRWSGRSSATSLQSSFNFNDSVTSKTSENIVNFGGSVKMMDFGASQRLAVLDESLRGCVLDETICIRSYASLDEFLDQWKEEFDNYDGEGGEFVDNLDGSIRSEGDLDDYVDSYDGFGLSTPQKKEFIGGCEKERVAGANNGSFLNHPVEGKRDEDEQGNKSTSQTSQEISSSRRPSRRRSIRRQSRRRGSHRWSGRSSSGSLGLGSSFNFSDSLISESGFMAWPSAAQEEVAGGLNDAGDDGNVTIQEEHADEVKREEEWHVEDHKKNTDDSGHNQRCLSEGSSGSCALAKTFQLFARVPYRRASTASSDPSLDGDLLKIKQTLLSAKSKEQGMEEVVVEENDDKKKRGGSISLISMFQQSVAAEMNEGKVEKESAPIPI